MNYSRKESDYTLMKMIYQYHGIDMVYHGIDMVYHGIDMVYHGIDMVYHPLIAVRYILFILSCDIDYRRNVHEFFGVTHKCTFLQYFLEILKLTLQNFLTITRLEGF